MHIINYPHPTLRFTSLPIKRVDAEFRDRVRQMFELMYAARGIGLAANQVDWPVRVFVVNLAGEAGKGEEQVFINPVLAQPRGWGAAEEGCLSLPGLYHQVARPLKVRVRAYDLRGQAIDVDAADLLARVVQHENDHLDGKLFVDHVPDDDRGALRPALAKLEAAFEAERAAGRIPADAEISEHLAAWTKRYC